MRPREGIHGPLGGTISIISRRCYLNKLQVEKILKIKAQFDIKNRTIH
jgi:hypothetical protein